MAVKKRHLIQLLLAAQIFTSYSYAEEQVNQITDPTALNTLVRILEKGESGIIPKNDLSVWQGNLTEHDSALKDYLVESKLYNESNADIFVRSISQDEVNELIEVLNDEKLKRTVGALSITRMRD